MNAPTSTAQYPASFNARRINVATRQTKDVPAAIAKRAVVKRACTCQRQGKPSGDYIDPGTLNGMGDAELAALAHWANQSGMGSWLSSAFKSITGEHLSDVIAPIATVAGSVFGGPIGGAIGSFVGGIASGGGSGQVQQPQPVQNATYAGQPAYSPYAVPTLPQGGTSVSDIINLISAFNRPAQSLAPAAPAQPTIIQNGTGFKLDSTTIAIGAAALLGVVLLTRK